jgi:uncharacterized protein (DUF2249 family)
MPFGGGTAPGEPVRLTGKLTGGKPQVISSHLPNAGLPRFSRDGRSIYVVVTKEAGAFVWKMPTAGGAAAQVTSNHGSISVESPDGQHLYYVETYERPSALWRLALAGGTPVKLLDGVVFGAFDVVAGGIYYLERPSLTSGHLRVRPAECRVAAAILRLCHASVNDGGA